MNDGKFVQNSSDWNVFETNQNHQKCLHKSELVWISSAADAVTTTTFWNINTNGSKQQILVSMHELELDTVIVQ